MPVVGPLLLRWRRRTERARERATDAAVAQQYQQLLEEAGEPILLADASQRFIFVNRRACEISGYAREELLRMRVGELLPRRLEERLAAIREGGPREIRGARELIRRDGTSLLVEVSAQRLADGGTLSIVHDVSEEHASVARLEREVARLRQQLAQLQSRENSPA
jgi:PAS domain S-box-containing protein